MRGISAAVALAMLAVMVLPGSRARAVESADFEDRIDFAYFTQDAAALRNLIRESRTALQKGAAASEAHYLLGFAHYRLGLLLSERERPAAASAMGECVDEMDEAVKAAAGFADAYALQSACYGQLAALRTFSAMISGPRSGSRLEKAHKLDPRNPRVALVEALADYERPKAFGGDKAKALVNLRKTVELFEKRQQSGEESFPSWGHADAQLALGRSLLETGDALGARNALERALLIAPEFVAAKRLLAQVLAGQ